ncbi:hypothetical protein A6R74_13905 [Halomonas sp. ALS9]|nr:hypothetical protein A6R74_13905 [Halomonas sp. ALS9]
MQGFVIDILNTTSCKHHYIHRGEVILTKANGFSNQTLETVAIYGAFNILFADHQSKAGMSPSTQAD